MNFDRNKKYAKKFEVLNFEFFKDKQEAERFERVAALYIRNL